MAPKQAKEMVPLLLLASLPPGEALPVPQDSEVVASGSLLKYGIHLLLVASPGAEFPRKLSAQVEVVSLLQDGMGDIIHRLFPHGEHTVEMLDKLGEAMQRVGLPEDHIERALENTLQQVSSAVDHLDTLFGSLANGSEEEEEEEGEGVAGDFTPQEAEGIIRFIRSRLRGKPPKEGDLTAEGVGESAKDPAQGDLPLQEKVAPQGGATETPA